MFQISHFINDMKIYHWLNYSICISINDFQMCSKFYNKNICRSMHRNHSTTFIPMSKPEKVSCYFLNTKNNCPKNFSTKLSVVNLLSVISFIDKDLFLIEFLYNENSVLIQMDSDLK